MMRFRQSAAVLLLMLVSSLIVFAAEVPPLNNQRIVDTAGLLNPQDRASMDRMLADFEAKTTNQIAVLIIPTLGDEDIEGFSNKAFRTYHLGQKDKNNGALLVIARNDRKLRIEVGYGLEGVLPDGKTGAIIREQITPQFKQNNFAGGINDGLRAMMGAIDAKYQAPATAFNNVPRNRQVKQIPTAVPYLLGGVAALIIGGATFGYIRRRRCPNCHKYTRKINDTVVTPATTYSSGYNMRYESCASCGYNHSYGYSTPQISHTTTYIGGGGGGGYGGGDSGGGGGFSGGGGDSGGGGASGSW